MHLLRGRLRRLPRDDERPHRPGSPLDGAHPQLHSVVPFVHSVRRRRVRPVRRVRGRPRAYRRVILHVEQIDRDVRVHAHAEQRRGRLQTQRVTRVVGVEDESIEHLRGAVDGDETAAHGGVILLRFLHLLRELLELFIQLLHALLRAHVVLPLLVFRLLRAQPEPVDRPAV
eukprot:31383-Pelagococcus_subviridis.AAC.12